MDRGAHLSATKRALLEKWMRGKASHDTIPKRPTDQPLALSFAQQRLWLLEQITPGNPAYNLSMAVRITIPLDLAAMEAAINAVIQRHEILRTRFTTLHGVPFQVIDHDVRIALTVYDVRSHPAAQRQSFLDQQLAQNAQKSFDLAMGPLMRADVFRLTDWDQVLQLTFHHIIMDGWSRGVLLQELGVLYADVHHPLPPVMLQYGDFAHWQRQQSTDDAAQADLAYWKQQLAGAPTVLDLPTDHPRPATPSFRGANHTWTISPALRQALLAFGKQEDATLFMLLLAVFQIVLFRSTGQPDLLIGTPLAGRTRVEIEQMIGFFVNTLVLRADLSSGPSFRALLARVRTMTLGAFAHQDVPFERLVEEFQQRRDLSRNPLFQVAFVLQNTPLGAMDQVGLMLQPYAFDPGIAQFDLTFSITEQAEELLASIEYATDLFAAETAARMAGHIQQVLEAVLADPDRCVDDIPLMRPDEQEVVLRTWNATEQPYDLTWALHQLFEQQAARTPDSVALVFEDQQITYAELDRRAHRLAQGLRMLGVGPEVQVGVCMERAISLVVALMGVLKAGGAYLPMDPFYPQARLAFMLENAGVPVILTQREVQEKVAGYAAQVVVCDDVLAGGSVGDRPLDGGLYPDNLAYVIYTSGSTGQPKGAMNTHGGIVNRLRWMQERYRLSAADRVLQKTPISFDVSVWEFFWPLLYGAALVVARPDGHRDSAYLVDLIAVQRITTLHFVPSMLQVFLEEPGLERCVDLRQVMCSGEALPFALQERFFSRHGAALHNLYGPTEAAVDVTAWSCERGVRARLVPIGRPIANIQVYILDPRGKPVPVGVAGELFIGGVGLARGYARRPDLTAERFVPNPFAIGDEGRSADDSAYGVRASSLRLYRTGDRVRYRSDGAIEFLDRLDGQVKVRGFRIELGEIEAVLQQHPGVLQAIVLARSLDGGERAIGGDRHLVAYVVLASDGAGATQGDLRAFLQGLLPEYMVPSVFVVLDALPLNPSGKVDRGALPLPDVRLASDVVFVAPRTPLEEVLAGIWADLLRLDRVGVYDNFFTTGGHSLLATQAISRIRTVCHVELPLRVLFESPTVASLAERIVAVQSLAPDSHVPALVPVPRTRPLPLSFAQQRLWFLDQFEPQSPFYNMFAALRLCGALDLKGMEQALRQVVARHEGLRTTFGVVDGQPVQVIAAVQDVPIDAYDVQQAPDGEAAMMRTIDALVRQPFDLMSGPLIRVALFMLAPDERVLLVVMHHIVSDGWSMGVLFRELVQGYCAYAAGQGVVLPALPIQYADFAVWQRQWLQGEVLERQLAYWRAQLANLPVLRLPTDRVHPPVQRFQGAQQTFVIGRSLTDALTVLGRQEGATLFMTLLTAFQVLLARYSGQTDVVVGTPIANRTRTEVEGLIGFFVNTLVLRTDLSGQPTFRAALRRVRDVAMEAYAHQDLPFERLVEDLQPSRSLSHNPLFQVMFALQNAPLEMTGLPGLAVRQVEVAQIAAKFDLGLDFWEIDGGLRGVWMYSVDLFDAETIARMTGHLQVVLEGCVAQPDCWYAELPLLTGVEQQLLFEGWSATAAENPRGVCIHDLFAQQAERSPDAVAVRVLASEQVGGESLRYRELNQRANQLAHYLRRRGVGVDVRVAICMERSPQLVVAILAVLKAGGAYVPLDPTYPRERLAWMLGDSQPLLVLTELRLVGHVPGDVAAVVCVDRDWPAAEPLDDPSVVVGAADAAYLIYTSGTTGTPKAVVVEHGNVLNVLLASQGRFGFGSATVMPWIASFAFDISLFELFNPLLSGGTSVCLTQQDVLDLGVFVGLLGWVTAFHAVPSLMRQIIHYVQSGRVSSAGFAQIGTIFVGGDAVPPDLVGAMQEVFPQAQVFVLYGPTEATIICTSYAVPRVGMPAKHLIGRPLRNTLLRVYDACQQPVPVGVPGELYIGGAGVTRGYLHQEGLTREKFVCIDGVRFYRSSDRVRYLADGTLEFLGRIDHQVKVRGFRIELGEIETVLHQFAGVREAVVLALADEQEERRLVAYVVPDAQVVEQEDQASWQGEQVDHWQVIFDETHGQPGADADALFNITGWNSSYTGQPIPADEMREWVACTVERLRDLGMRRVLEIGCGTGLLLFQLAPFCESYLGTDFAAGPLVGVRRQIREGGASLAHVAVAQQPANDVTGVEPGSVDLVILNSVVQYFPSAEYLLDVLGRALAVVAPGGVVFVGDVRSLPLLEAYHASVQVYQAVGSADCVTLRQQVYKRIADEEELVIDPGFFMGLRQRWPSIQDVRVLVKRGRYENELTRYRYDVVITTGPVVSGPEPLRLGWREDGVTLAGVRQVLREQVADVVWIRGVPNARVAADLKVLELLALSHGPRCVEDLVAGVRQARLEGVDPEDVWVLGQEFPYRVEVVLGSGGGAGEYDVVLSRLSVGRPLLAVLVGGEVVPQERVLTNNPLHGRLGRRLVPQLRRFLQERLPEYMVPAAFVMLAAFPLTPNGKLDRGALPQPDHARPTLERAYVAPRNPVEEALAQLCAEMLSIERVGIFDDFFDLGGHSLLVTQIVSRIRDSFGVEVPLRRMFEAPTVASLADLIVQCQLQQLDSVDVAEALEGIRGLSDEEIALLLAQEDDFDGRMG